MKLTDKKWKRAVLLITCPIWIFPFGIFGFVIMVVAASIDYINEGA